MAKVKPVAIIVEEQYQVLEVWYSLLRLREEQIPVVVVGSGSRDIYPSKEGYPVRAEKSVDQVKPEEFSCVIIPGGWAPDFLRRYPAMVDLVKRVYNQGGVIAAICHGGWMLVSAGICRGHQATCFYAIKDDIIAAGAQYVDQEVVVDRNLITARKPEDLPAFMKEIINKLHGPLK